MLPGETVTIPTQTLRPEVFALFTIPHPAQEPGADKCYKACNMISMQSLVSSMGVISRNQEVMGVRVCGGWGAGGGQMWGSAHRTKIKLKMAVLDSF